MDPEINHQWLLRSQRKLDNQTLCVLKEERKHILKINTHTQLEDDSNALVMTRDRGICKTQPGTGIITIQVMGNNRQDKGIPFL